LCRSTTSLYDILIKVLFRKSVILNARLAAGKHVVAPRSTLIRFEPLFYSTGACTSLCTACIASVRGTRLASLALQTVERHDCDRKRSEKKRALMFAKLARSAGPYCAQWF